MPVLEFPDVVDQPLAFALWMLGIVATMVLVKLQFDALCMDYALRKLPSAPGWIPVCGDASAALAHSLSRYASLAAKYGSNVLAVLPGEADACETRTPSNMLLP